MPYIVNRDFCKQWKSNADQKDRQYCRKCRSQPCQELWFKVKSLASSNNGTGITAYTLAQRKPFRLFTTPKQGQYHCFLQVLSSDRVGVVWGLPKEDFLYVLKTGNDHTPSHTRQKSHVESIIKLMASELYNRDLIEKIRRI